MRKRKVLIHAQKSGAIVKVVYKAGSQPNHARQIIPLRIKDNQVFAQCLNSNTKKAFLIRKLKLLTNQQYDNFTKWDPNFTPATDYELYEIQKQKMNKLLCYFFTGFIILILFVYLLCRLKTQWLISYWKISSLIEQDSTSIVCYNLFSVNVIPEL